MTKTITLFHGTTKAHGESLRHSGWQPRSGMMGGQCGNPSYLYLTNHPENALWFAEQKGDCTVVEVDVPLDILQVDPQDGTYDTVDEELSALMPGSFVAVASLPAHAFRLHEFAPRVVPHRPPAPF
jgi:hypothetical protein